MPPEPSASSSCRRHNEDRLRPCLTQIRKAPDALSRGSAKCVLAIGNGRTWVSAVGFDALRLPLPRLVSFVAANPGMSLSSAANRLVDEALRTTEHPGVVFRAGPTGRRAALAGGPDIWEVIRAVKSAHAAEPELDSDGLLGLVSDNTGIALRLLSTAVRYWRPTPTRLMRRSPQPMLPKKPPSRHGCANASFWPGNP